MHKRREKSKTFKPQVDKEHYYSEYYNTKNRWISYWYQINEIRKKNPEKILEIGVGNRLVSKYLYEHGYDIKTCDIDENLKPDVVGSIMNLPFKDESFDYILCAQVLEHLPFKYFQKALSEINRVTRKWFLLTLPDYSITYIHLAFKLIPFIPKISHTFKIRFPVKHKFEGEHYWEIGKKGYSLGKIRAVLREAGFNISKDYVPRENLYHHFFLLEK